MNGKIFLRILFKKKFLILFLLILILSSPQIFISVYADLSPSLNGTRATTKNWTIMIYMDGDNSLGAVPQKDMVVSDLKELQASGGSDSNINIITLVDKYGWYNSKCYYISSSGLSEVSLSTVGFSSSREFNMGNPETLSTFVDWAITNYPASNYALVLWDHGSGWNTFCCDDTNADELTANELESALVSIKAEHGRLDIIGFDACYMASNTLIYQIKNYGEVYIGSETREPFNGWDYESSVSWLKSNPTANASQFATRIVTDYDSYYSTQYTLSAIDLQKYDVQLSDTLNLLLQALKHRSATYNSQLYSVSAGTLFYKNRLGSNTLCDLYDFADSVKLIVTNTTIQAYCTTLMNKIGNAVIYEKHSTDLSNSHGVTFYFPSSATYFDYTFFNTKWHTDSSHYAFLKNYWHTENTIVALTLKPTIKKVGTTCYVNGSGAQAKIDRGDWRTGEIPVSTGSHQLYTRRYVDGEYSEINQTSISGVSLVITPASSGAYTISLIQGWNLITAPSTTSLTAKTWCIELGAKEIIRKNTVTGAYEEYIYDISSDSKDFAIDSTKGYYVYMENGSTYTFQSLTTRPVSLAEKWNLVGIGADVKASTILSNSDSIKSVTKRNSDGSYSTYVSEVAIGDFTIDKGHAGFVFTSNPQAIRV